MDHAHVAMEGPQHKLRSMSFHRQSQHTAAAGGSELQSTVVHAGCGLWGACAPDSWIRRKLQAMASDYYRCIRRSQGLAPVSGLCLHSDVPTSVACSDSVAAVQVYAIDLLGFGGSDKALIDYSIEVWAEQVVDFCQEFAQAPVTLVGNSIGSLVSLEAAHMMKGAASAPEVQGIALINCAGVFWNP